MRLLLLAAFAVGAWAQPKIMACKIVTQEDAVAILGPKAVQHSGPGSCAYDAAGSSYIFVVIVDSSPNVATQIQIPRQSIPKAGGTVRDEPSVAPSAFSTKLPRAQSIYFLKKNTAVSVTVTSDKANVPEMLDKLRVVARRIAARL